MKQSAPDFNSSRYERPNQDWICGKAAEGKACWLGPNAQGKCRTTCECQPALKIKPGDAKGRYYCTRPAEFGGPCARGPLPDGTCARPIPKCVPVRSLRAKRKVLTLSVVVLTTGFLLVALFGSNRWRFISPGPLSAPHSTTAVARLIGGGVNCAVCHGAGRGGFFTWLRAGMAATPGFFQFHALAAKKDFDLTTIDQNCLVCHPGHTFHEPNVTRTHSCTDCHVEHQGGGPMRPPTDANCLACHGKTDVMQASLAFGAKLPADAFDFRPERGRVLFHAPRPERGYTSVIHSFATDHPEFQIVRDQLKDPDTLKFNHQLHLTSARVKLRGRKLDCADCHKPDAAGVYHLKITYEENCGICHKNQFDVRNPGLLIPHGNSENVRAFLRTLPQQYADFAERTKRPGGHARDEAFAQQQITLLRADFASGEELERSVFFNEKRQGPVARVAGSAETGPALFPGCAYCHEVRPSLRGAPQITPPLIPDRWLVHGNFDHSKHLQNVRTNPKMDCIFCHDARQSRETSDILLPSKQICAMCHSPAGGVVSSCSTCHGYHPQRKESELTQTREIKGMDSLETLRKATASRDR